QYCGEKSISRTFSNIRSRDKSQARSLVSHRGSMCGERRLGDLARYVRCRRANRDPLAMMASTPNGARFAYQTVCLVIQSDSRIPKLPRTAYPRAPMTAVIE